MTEINLLPQITAEEQKRKRELKKINFFSTLGLGIFLVVTIGAFGYWALLVNEITTLNQTFADREKQLGQQVEIEGLFKAVGLKVKEIRLLKPKIRTPSVFLENAINLAPDGIRIGGITIESDQVIKFSGSASSQEQLTDFLGKIEKMRTLAESPVKSVKIDSVSLASSGSFNFAITIEINPPVKKS